MKKLSLLLATLLATGSALAQLASINAAKKLYEDRKPAEAKKLLAPIDDDSKEYAQAQYWLGRIAFDEKKYDESADFFGEAIDANDKVAEYHYWHGAAMGSEAQGAGLMRKGFLAPKIKSAFEQTLALDPKHADAMYALIQYYVQAPSMMGGDKVKALELANRLKALDKVRGHLQVAYVYASDNKLDLAEKEYVALAKAEPDKWEYQVALGNFYISNKQYQRAFDLYDAQLKKNPNDMPASYQYGRAGALSGLQLDRAEACLRAYLKHQPGKDEPQPANAYHRLGMVCEKKGNKAEAKKCYEAAVKLDPNLKEAKELLAKLK
jgi:tetratricopeptide (TPR) repeat protein